MLRYFEDNKQAAQYLKYRPKLTDEVAKCIMNYCRTHQTEKDSSKPSLMVDVGCGSGQATNIFHSYFEKIIGIDVSMEQLNQAKKQNIHENIQYLEGRAESMPLKDDSVEPKFFQEVERILKPSGCLAIIGYYVPTLRLLSKKDDDILAQKATKLFENVHIACAKQDDKLSFPFEQSRLRHKDIFEMIPFAKKERNDSIHLCCLSSINGICGVLRSFATYQSFMEKESLKFKDHDADSLTAAILTIDPLIKLSQDLMELWGLKEEAADDLLIELDYNIFVSLGAK